MNLLSSLLKYTADQIAALRAKNTSQDTTVSGIDTRLGTAETKVTNMEAQLATAISAVTVDSEVQNIRVGDDNVTYTSAGEAVRTQFSDVKSALSYSNNGLQTFSGLGNFQHYGLNPDGSFLTSQKYRVSNDDPITFDRDITVIVSSDFKWGFIPFVNGVAQAWRGWLTTPQTIMAGTSFVVQIARASENTSEIANVSEFLSAITFLSVPGVADKTANNLEKYLGLAEITTTWEQGGINSSGIAVSDTARIRTPFLPIYDGISINADERYSTVVVQYDASKTFIGGTSWAKGAYVITPSPNAKYFRAVLSKEIGGTLSITPAESIYACIKYIINDLWSQFNDLETIVKGLSKSRTYKYIGEGIPSKANSFDITNVFTMSYSGGLTSQDIEVYGDYMFVAFSGDTEIIRVYSLTDYSLVGTITIATNHGSSMQFSNEYYDENDSYPLLYVGGWANNKINVIRITESGGAWSATKIKTLYISPTYGYFASPSIDKNTNILYTYAHSNVDIPNTDEMIIASWDLSSLTDNGDGTYTPKLLNYCKSPSIGTYQGHKYYGGRIYITSARGSSPYNQKLFAIDCGSGELVTTIDLSSVLTLETEGLCYRVNADNSIEWYLSEYYKVFKFNF